MMMKKKEKKKEDSGNRNHLNTQCPCKRGHSKKGIRPDIMASTSKQKSRRITKRRAQAWLREELNRDSRQKESAMKRAAAKVESFKRYLKCRDAFVADP